MFINTETKAYPVTEQEIRAAFPNGSFGSPFVPPAPWAEVIPTPHPEYDMLTQGMREGDPVLVAGKYQQSWEVYQLSAAQIAANLAEEITSFVRRIDADADQIYAAALGNRATEYSQAESDATAYKSAGYTGAVQSHVQAWAIATGKSAKWAADDILATAAAWRAAQSQIRANRLACKEAARSATTIGQLATAQSNWSAFVSALCAQLGITI